MLPPSSLECSASRRCRLLGIRSLNCPEYPFGDAGSAISTPLSSAAVSHSFFRIFCIFCSLFHGTPNGNTSGQIRITGHVSSLIRIRENFQPIGKSHIVFNRFYFQISSPPPVVPCFRTKKAACADTQTAFVSLTEQPWQFPPVWRKQRHRSQPCRPGLSGPAQRRLWSGRR